MFILRNPHRAYDTRYLLICTDDFSQKIGGKIDVHTLKYFSEFQSITCLKVLFHRDSRNHTKLAKMFDEKE